MPARLPPVPRSAHRYAAILSFDPAAVTDCGVAVRLTATLPNKPERGRLRYPDHVYAGPVHNTREHDALASFLNRNLATGDRVLLAIEDCVFGNRRIARSIGIAVGVLEGLLVALNVYDPEKDRKWVRERDWRAHAFPTSRPQGRDALKEASVELISTLYGEEVTDDLAEAICIGDYVVLERRELWKKTK